MSTIGNVDSLWRYPVKSMRGEELEEAFIGFSGVYGDRMYAFRSSASKTSFPWLTARDQADMLRYRPRFRCPNSGAQPANLADAERLGPGVTPLYADPANMVVDVETPSGEVLAIDAPKLSQMLTRGKAQGHQLTLLRSDRSLTDCRPISLISTQTARALGDEVGIDIDPRRFRANIYVDLGSPAGFVEDGLVGRAIRIGSKAVLSIIERDPRCKVITLDPDTGESNPQILRAVAQDHDNKIGVYGVVLVEGMIRRRDLIEVLT